MKTPTSVVVSGDRGEVDARGVDEPGVRRDAGADRGRAEVDLEQLIDDRLEAGEVLGNGRSERVELLLERHRDGILQLRAPDLQDAREFGGLQAERVRQRVELRQQALDRAAQPDLERGRIAVVRALAAVDVIVGMESRVPALRQPGELKAEVGDHLVDVHVGRRAGASLHDVDDELVAQSALLDLLARAIDQIGLGALECADLGVRARGGLFDAGKAEDQIGVDRDRPAADRKVVQRTAGVDAPVGVARDLLRAEAVGFDAGLGHGSSLFSEVARPPISTRPPASPSSTSPAGCRSSRA
jgi:hypothetical protein